ncbi:MAG TPA: 3'-5' exonuclease, partial [Methanomassiliicoccales archaeon]|nr:3'-5' exonuclease [Methanomassiliicoccales archaeon]
LGTVRRKEQEGPFTLYDLIDWLNASMANSEREGQAQLEAVGDAVRIMTVHASKGLEFPVVLVPEAEAAPREERDPAALTPTGLFAEVPTPDLSTTYPPAPLRPALRELKARMEAESLRLFYVAATRARDHLVVLGGRKKEGAWEPIDKDRRDWFALTLNGLGIADAEAGTIPLDEDGRYALSLETFEAAGGGLSLEPVRPCVVPEGLERTPAARVRPEPRVELVFPSALDERTEGRLKGGEGSELKRLLTSRGMDAAEYGTLVHEALRGKEAGTLLRFSRASLSPEETEWAARELQGIVARFMASEPMAPRRGRQGPDRAALRAEGGGQALQGDDRPAGAIEGRHVGADRLQDRGPQGAGGGRGGVQGADGGLYQGGPRARRRAGACVPLSDGGRDGGRAVKGGRRGPASHHASIGPSSSCQEGRQGRTDNLVQGGLVLPARSTQTKGFGANGGCPKGSKEVPRFLLVHDTS